MEKLLRVKSDFNTRQISGVEHGLVGHPLFELDALRDLAKKLPKNQLRYHSGMIPVTESLETAPEKHATGLSVEDTLKNIETSGSFVFLQKVHTVPEYAEIMNQLLDSVEPMIRKQEGRMHIRQAWIFISSPGIVTPYHRDHETNFLLQLRGSKSVNVFPTDDLDVCSHEESEILHAEHSLRATQHSELKQSKATVFEVGPGQGAYMPYTAPHWVKNGPEVSVTLSVTFYTDTTRVRKNVYSLNHRLRKRGMSPTPYGKSPWLDSVKHGLMRGYESIRQARTGQAPYGY